MFKIAVVLFRLTNFYVKLTSCQQKDIIEDEAAATIDNN